ncbi:hypothetical protein [Agromyces marinus]|uniref:ATP-binding protein n=1 Tax=Agromyces marinus TaxID=1389020 RepID=A0ABM8H027_9MICO|nr:hypothetical protein [Agromyces marinus]UIP57725.1 hypothetical protein DSM26151_05900 [Agromyces marinus]BDZ54107.1 hypothetical protein GCM10025870_11800 [Agromyces marinus]
MGVLDDLPFDETDPDAQALVELLRDQVGKDQAKMYAGASGVPHDEVDWDGPMALVWPRIIRVAVAHRRLRTLVLAVYQEAQGLDLLARLIEQPATAAPAAPADDGPAGDGSGGPGSGVPDPWDTPRLWRREAMIGRARLRDRVREMIARDGDRALLITGDHGSGKSNSRRFMSWLAESEVLPKVHVLDNSRRAGSPMDAQELAVWVASTLAGAQAPSFDLVAQPESIVTQFRGWLSSVTSEFDAPVWLVFDGFTSENTTAPGLQLIHDLAASVADRQLDRLRVAVCGFEGVEPGYPGAMVEPLEHPTDAEVKAFFKRMSVLLEHSASDDDAIEVLFAEFEGRGGPVAARALAELGPSALELANEVYGGAS